MRFNDSFKHILKQKKLEKENLLLLKIILILIFLAEISIMLS